MSREFDKYVLLPTAARIMREEAERMPLCDGRATPLTASIIDRGTYYHTGTGTRVVLTRDTGYHTSGWWKNPDYERCWHLSLSFRGLVDFEILSKNEKLTQRWIDAMFGEDKKLLWSEPPSGDDGKKYDVWHYRLFCDEGWQPIMPRGEVYSKQFTERGWLSFSDLNYQREKTAE